MSQNLRNKLPIHYPRRVKTSTAPQSKSQIAISSSYTSKFNVHKSAIVGEKSFNVALSFTILRDWKQCYVCQTDVAGNNNMFLGLRVICPVFLSDVNQV